MSREGDMVQVKLTEQDINDTSAALSGYAGQIHEEESQLMAIMRKAGHPLPESLRDGNRQMIDRLTALRRRFVESGAAVGGGLAGVL